KEQAPRLEVKTDSFVLESDVHYPTDCNLLWGASRKCIELLSRLQKLNIGCWRKNVYWKSEVKNARRACERLVSRGGPNKAERVLKTVQDYLEKAYALEKRPSVRLAGWFRLPLEGDRGQ
ncbi:MAG: IS5 family transposase, partial [Verrucomicrobiales bacterium]